MQRFLPFAVILLVIGLFFGLGGHEWLTLEKLTEHRLILQDHVQSNQLFSIFIFGCLYTIVVAASLPGAALLSLAAGFLFGQWLGTGLVVLSATTGAVLLFLMVDTTFGGILKAKAGPWFQKISAGFQDNAISYMLFLRLIPIFPFFAVNIAGAMLGIRLRDFSLTTAVGILPGSFVFVSAGVGLDAVLETGEIINRETQIAFVGLGLVSLLPVLYKVWSKRRHSAD